MLIFTCKDELACAPER